MAQFHLDLDAVRGWCERNSIRYLYNETLNQIAIPRPMQRGWAVRMIPRPERKMFTIGLPVPLPVPEERLEAVAEALSRANGSVFMGAWVLNRSSGEVYFRVSVPTEGVSYDDDALRFLVQVVIGTVEAVATNLKAVVEGASPDTIMSRPDAEA